jgi:hypothetical protein
MIDLLERLFTNNLSEKTGRTANPVAESKEALKHWERWNAVIQIRVHTDLPWSKTWAAAAESLQGTPWFAASATIRKSYERIEKALKDPARSGSVFVPTDETAQNLKLQG